MPKVRTIVRLLAACLAVLVLGAAALEAVSLKLDPLAAKRATLLTGRSRVIVRASDTASDGDVVLAIRAAGGTITRSLPILHAWAADMPNTALTVLADNPLVARVSLDRILAGAMERTGVTIGASTVRSELGYDGAGVGVAVIDSGVTAWHDDLAGGGAQRVAAFVDLVNGQQSAYDDYGHGSHVAGIIVGNGFDSDGARTGIAPAAHLVVVKVLDAAGRGHVSDIIAALDYVVAHKNDFNIRVVNLSVAAGVYESYNSDPLTLAAQRAAAAGIVVVAAAGNAGRDQQGRTAYGGITAPGNAPWVLTVGASSHMGTINRADDTMAAFSSRGPSAVDYRAKPDLVAPGVGLESLSDPASVFYTTHASSLLPGSVPTSYLPYLSLSGTSMAAPVVAGTVALMLQANPALTPNQVKAILEYTAQVYAGYDPLTQGAGFLNAKGAVELARYLAAPTNVAFPYSPDWGARLIWGNHLVRGGRLTAGANAWSLDTTWGAATTAGGQGVEWGVMCPTATCDAGGWEAWRANCADETCSTVTWGGEAQDVVWGSACGGADCPGLWSIVSSGGAVWSTNDGDTVVWGTNGDGDTVVWGTSDGDTVVWGTSCSDPSCQPVIWNRP